MSFGIWLCLLWVQLGGLFALQEHKDNSPSSHREQSYPWIQVPLVQVQVLLWCNHAPPYHCKYRRNNIVFYLLGKLSPSHSCPCRKFPAAVDIEFLPCDADLLQDALKHNQNQTQIPPVT